MHDNTISFRSLLREELVARCQRNPAYSARALARDLRLSPAFLSQVINGRRSLSEGKSHEVAERLGWEGERRRVFTGLVRYDNARTIPARENILKELKGTRAARQLLLVDLELENFKVVADWHHLAIAELTQVEGFRDDPRWIARKLGIPAQTARAAIARLKRVGILIEQDGKLTKAAAQTRVGDVPSAAIRAHHRQLIEKASAALEDQTPAERDITGTTFAIDPKRLPEARELIRDFRHRMLELLEGGRKRSLYQLSVQLFRLETKS